MHEKKDAHKKDLIEHAIRGGFSMEMYETLRNDRNLAYRVAKLLVASHFPNASHDAILKATSISSGP